MDCHPSWIDSWLVLDCQQLVLNAHSEPLEVLNDFSSTNNWTWNALLEFSAHHSLKGLHFLEGGEFCLETASCWVRAKNWSVFQPRLCPSDGTMQLAPSLKCNTTLIGRNTPNVPISFWSSTDYGFPIDCLMAHMYTHGTYECVLDQGPLFLLFTFSLWHR